MTRILMISSDCHVMARVEDYRPYVETAQRAAFDR